MKIGTRYITVNRNIRKVESDFLILTDNNESEDITKQIKMFHGKMDGRQFEFKNKNITSSRSVLEPILYGELIQQDANNTLIKIDIHLTVNGYILILNIVLIIYLLYSLIDSLIRWSDNKAGFFLVLSLLIGIPTMYFVFYFFSIRSIINTICNYASGFLDSYIK